MSDASIASAGRELARALMKFARERGDPEKKAVSQAQADLCEAYRTEIAEPPPPEEPQG